MSPQDRRDAVLAAAVPLLRSRGASVTTRELADAAGVAEGTLFRVFPDKEALVCAALERALDAGPVVARLTALDARTPLRATATHVVEVLQRHVGDVAVLLSVSHELHGGASGGGRTAGHGHHHRQPVEDVVAGVAEVLEPHRGELRLDPATCARVLVGLVLAAHRPLGAAVAPDLGPSDLVTLFVDGARARADAPEGTC